jgi:hypothetical protein
MLARCSLAAEDLGQTWLGVAAGHLVLAPGCRVSLSSDLFLAVIACSDCSLQ